MHMKPFNHPMTELQLLRLDEEFINFTDAMNGLRQIGIEPDTDGNWICVGTDHVAYVSADLEVCLGEVLRWVLNFESGQETLQVEKEQQENKGKEL